MDCYSQLICLIYLSGRRADCGGGAPKAGGGLDQWKERPWNTRTEDGGS